MTRYRKLPRVTAKLIRAAGDAIARRAGEGRLCIVSYHGILERPDPLLDSEPDVDTFRWQVGPLADCSNVLPLAEAVRALAAGNLPPRAVAITLAGQRVDIGGYTVSHPILTRIDDDAAQFEIVENKRQLEAITGRPVTLFAYPNGKHGIDYDQRHVRMVSAAGYQAAFTTAIGSATRHDDLFQIPRSRPWDASHLMFAACLLKWLAGRSA